MAAKLLLLPLAVMAAIAISGCAVSSTPVPVGEPVKGQILSYANPLADSMLAALNAGDYGQFSANFSQAMGDAMDRDKFESLASNLYVSIGKYVSRDSAIEVVEIGGYYRVTYTAQFTQDSPVSFIISFKKDGRLVEGVFLSSKKLSGKLN